MTDATVTENAAQHRFELHLDDDRPVGITVYQPRTQRLYAFVHTEVDEGHEGKGLGSTLIGSALDAMRDRQVAVLPYCPFVRAFIARHGGYLDLVPVEQRDEFGLPLA